MIEGNRPRLLDLFCGAGGAAMGYHRAGFNITGVDIEPQPDYPFEFHQADALEYVAEHGGKFDAIHASPPCQGYSTITKDRGQHPHLIGVVRILVQHFAVPYVIENVAGAVRDMRSPFMLCGGSFGLDVRRHRLFETNVPMLCPPCNHLGRPLGVHGHPGGNPNLAHHRPATLATGSAAMGIDWMTWPELTEAIPPAYTEYIGGQLLDQLVTA